MKKLILIATAILFALSLGAAFAADMPKEDRVINTGPDAGKKPAVIFSHTKHQAKDIKCDACHHQVDGKDINKNCGSCHNVAGDNGKPKLKNAMHGKKGPGACYTCHLKKGAEHKKKCAECHVK